MTVKKRYSIGFGSIFSLIVVYFIYLYAKEHGWVILKWVTFAYLAVVIGAVLLFVLILALISLVLLIFFIYTKRVSRKVSEGEPARRPKKEIGKNSIDAEYEVKD
ncbi:MAG: hypothetical protein ABII01_00765 [Candidatus Woesearchaeota archaeon]